MGGGWRLWRKVPIAEIARQLERDDSDQGCLCRRLLTLRATLQNQEPTPPHRAESEWSSCIVASFRLTLMLEGRAHDST